MLGEVTTTLVSRFEAVRLGDAASVGGKGANLGEMTAAGLPIPPGFVVTAEAYLHAVEAGGIRQRLRDGFRAAAAAVDDPAALSSAAAALRRMIAELVVPDAVRRAILGEYHRLGDRIAVAVRSEMFTSTARRCSVRMVQVDP